jgi:predicted CXXCH cytochrome family protein
MTWQKFLITVGTIMFLSACGQIKNRDTNVISLSQSRQSAVLMAAPVEMARTTQQNGCFDNGCHSDLNSDAFISKHLPFANGECQLCHSENPHHQLIERTPNEEIALCISCHSVESLGNSHPIGDGVIDPNTGKALSCVTCHSPHYSNHTYQLILDGSGELCVHCHKEFLSQDF